MIDMIETGKRIDQKIKSNGYERKILAKEVGVSTMSICKWIKGYSVPTIDNLVILSILFNCKIDDLIVISETGNKAVAAGAQNKMKGVL